jgi:endonuclease/exonuclease/phosphatase family metal-dependent hydrolase
MQNIIQGAYVGWSIIRGTIRPQCLMDEVPAEFKAAKHAVRRDTAATAPGKDIRIISWNILRNYNKGKIRKGISELMKERGADIIFIQEAPVYNDGNFWDESIFKEYSAYYAPLHFPKRQSQYYCFRHTGNLILSRHKLVAATVYELPTPVRDAFGKEHVIKRIAAYVRIGAKKSIGIYNVHLENMSGSKGRLMQVKHLLGIIDDNDDDVVIVGGDFNTIYGNEACLKELEKAGFKRMAIAETRILPRLDFLFVKGAEIEGGCDKKEGSDHYPLWGRITI